MSTQQKFCKLFETESYGQLLCLVKESDDDADGLPAIFIYFQPPGFGLCHNKLSYNEGMDVDEAWEKAGEFLENLTEEQAIVLVGDVVQKLTTLNAKEGA